MKSIFLRRLLLTITLISLSSIASAQVKGQIKLTLLEGGGNGAAYGFAGALGPSNRTQSFTCPRTSLGEIPTGRTSCTTTYGSSVKSEWQPGDKLRFFSFAASSTDLPFNLRTPDLVRCSWVFKGWSGPCAPQGIVDNNRHECILTLPSSGNVEIGAIFEGADYLGNPCPVIGGGTPSPGPTPTPGSGVSTLDGAALAGAIGNAASDIIIRMGLRKLLSLTALTLNLPAGASAGTVQVSLSSDTGGRSLTGRGLSVHPRSSSTVIATGAVSIAAQSTSKLKLKLTKYGRSYLKGKRSARFILVAKFDPSSPAVRKVYSKTKRITVVAK